MRRRTRSTPTQHRLGFTLIELLVVIVILGILIGLLVPAVMRAVGTAKEAACAAEIRAMSQALADFNSKYGGYPPSRIIISETGDYSASAATLLGQRSMTYLRKFWPRLQLSSAGAVTSMPGGYYDVNGNGAKDLTPYTLTGPECLVLFLGGIPQGNGVADNWSVTGFSKNPLNPFQPSSVTTNRTIPYFEFNNSRLKNNKFNASVQAGGGFPGYVDSLGVSTDPSVIPFYCYFSAYGGVGYDPDDVDFAEPDTAGTIAGIKGAFTSANAATPTTFSGNVISSFAPNPYTTDPPVYTDSSGALASGKPPAWQNAQTFQIISCGQDRLYGIGGQYLANNSNRLPFVDGSTVGYGMFQAQQTNATVTSQSVGADARAREKDNVTNFSAGKLD